MVQRNQTAEDSSPLIKWLPADQWIDGNAADSQLSKYSAGSFRLTTTNGAYASFSFNGTGIWIYGAKRGNHGPYRCNLDGNDRPIQDGYSATDDISAELCQAPNLKMGPHVMTITNLWNDSTRPYLDVDYIIWETEISDQATQSSIVLDDTDASIQYTPQGEWNTNECNNMAAYSANSCHVTGSNTAKASLTFQGDAVAIYGGVGPQYGPYAVVLDGGNPVQYTANSTNAHTQQILYFASDLGAGNHTVVIKNNPASIGNLLDIDYVQVLGAGMPTPGSSGGNNNASSGGGSKVGPIVGAVVGVIALLAIAGLLFFFWRRRKQARKRNTVDLTDNDKDGSNVAMAHALPTPYVVPAAPGRNESTAALYHNTTNNASTNSISMPQAQTFNRPYTGYGTQYTMSEGYPDTPGAETFGGVASPTHRSQQPSLSTNAGNNFASGSSNGEGSSGRGANNSSAYGGLAPVSAVGGPGEKGAQLYTGPTVRNDSGEQIVDAPPSYTR